MVKPTPSRFNPDLLARDSSLYSVKLPLGQFTRLRELLLDSEGEMQATFRFSRRKELVLVKGELTAQCRLECQRCLEPMQYQINSQFELVFAKTEQIAHDMPEGFDPVVLDETGQIHVVDLFEDELILNLPTVARHASDQHCDASEHLLAQGTLAANTDGESKDDEQTDDNKAGPADPVGEPRKNPFDVLKDLDLH